MSSETSSLDGASDAVGLTKASMEHAHCGAAELREHLFAFGPQSLTRPPQAIAAFVERLIRHAKYYDGPDSRSEPRYAVRMPVAAVPVDDDLQRIGEPFVAVSRDLSGKGIAIYHTRRISQRYLALELSTPSDEKLHVLLQVLRCRPVGLFYEIAGNFVSKIARDRRSPHIHCDAGRSENPE
jgi:hypothetical protein